MGTRRLSRVTSLTRTVFAPKKSPNGCTAFSPPNHPLALAVPDVYTREIGFITSPFFWGVFFQNGLLSLASWQDLSIEHPG
jgi:hypothetical protein